MEVQAAVWRIRSKTLSENGPILGAAGGFSSAPRRGESIAGPDLPGGVSTPVHVSNCSMARICLLLHEDPWYSLFTLRPRRLYLGCRINLRAVGSPGSVSSRRDRREERGKSLPSSGTRGLGGGGRPSLSNRTSPRTSRSPDSKRTSMSFGDFVAARWV